MRTHRKLSNDLERNGPQYVELYMKGINQPNNENHHIWNNNGTWWIHYVVYDTATAVRVRRSLKTKNLRQARKKRDSFFKTIKAKNTL